MQSNEVQRNESLLLNAGSCDILVLHAFWPLRNSWRLDEGANANWKGTFRWSCHLLVFLQWGCGGIEPKINILCTHRTANIEFSSIFHFFIFLNSVPTTFACYAYTSADWENLGKNPSVATHKNYCENNLGLKFTHGDRVGGGVVISPNHFRDLKI